MSHRGVALLLFGAFLLAGNPAAADDPAGPEAFVDAMLRGLGARRTECPPDVIEPVRRNEMQAVCARYDGSFPRFALRWDLEVVRAGGISAAGADRPRSHVEPQTDWESNGDTHDRIYRVGMAALGVRFDAGSVVLVW